MKTINFSHTRQNLASTFDSVVDNCMPVVIISIKDYRAIAQLENGQGTTRELIEE